MTQQSQSPTPTGESRGRVRFSVVLMRPAPERGKRPPEWLFAVLPSKASKALPSRGMVSVEGTMSGAAFRATLEPDGSGGHWIRVDRALWKTANVEVGGLAAFELSPVAPGLEPEPRVPADFRAALANASSTTRLTWEQITRAARRDWIHWITSGKKTQTRLTRISKACDMLAKGKRRPCCFDRSGMYSKSLGCPTPEQL